MLNRTLEHLETNEVRLVLKLATKRINNLKYRSIILEILEIVFGKYIIM